MDTSETYIKMCEKAEEIQKLRPEKEYPHYEDGDILLAAWPDGSHGVHTPRVGVYSVLGNDPDMYGKPIWLPRQDQLQGMIGDFDKQKGLVQAFLDSEIGDEMSDLWNVPPETMEQLWLAFVMKEKFDKTWNGSEWVKEA